MILKNKNSNGRLGLRKLTIEVKIGQISLSIRIFRFFLKTRPKYCPCPDLGSNYIVFGMYTYLVFALEQSCSALMIELYIQEVVFTLAASES